MAKIGVVGKLVGLLAIVGGSGCAGVGPAPCVGPVADEAVAWIVDQGWHTDIGVPVDELVGPLSRFRVVFPGATVVMFGFGKRTWMTARVESASELLMGPFPGPGAIQVVGLRATPDVAYRGNTVIRLALTPEEGAGLAGFIWSSIGKTRLGAPRLISRGLFPGSLFYAATREYGPGYTCNGWTAEALQSAGLAVRPDGVMFAGGVLDQIARLPQACQIPG